MKLKRIVKFEHGHDCIKFKCKFNSPTCEPGAGGSHGLRGVVIRFVLKGEQGAVQFTISTDWHPRKVEGAEAAEDSIFFSNGEYSGVFPDGLGYLTREPQYEGQPIAQKECEYLDGAPCYYGGSPLTAYDAMLTLVNGGDSALWEFLTQYYKWVFFDGEDHPEALEYSKPLR